MARVLNSPIGDLRGSIGGNTFSRNRSGSIVRARTQPVNRNTVAQQKARAAFGQASQAFGGLGYEIQSLWNAFAQDGARFNPVNGVNTGQYTGAQAFTSCYAIQKAIQAQPLDTFINDAGFSLVKGEAAVPHSSPSNFPLYGQLLCDSAGDNTDEANINSLISFSSSLYSNGIVLQMVFEKDFALSATEMVLLDKSGSPIAFALYASTPVKQVNMRPKREMYVKVIQTPILSMKAGVGSEDNVIQIKLPLDSAQFTLLQSLPTLFTLVVQNEYGQQKKIGSQFNMPTLSVPMPPGP